MKNLKLMMMAGLMAFATAANAQEEAPKLFTANDIFFETEQADLNVYMDYDGEFKDEICTWQFEFYLPDGIEPIFDEEEEAWLGEVSRETNRAAIAKAGLNIVKTVRNSYLVLGYDTNGNKPMTSTKGLLCTITLSGNKDITGEGKLNNMVISNLASESVNKGNWAECIFKVNGENPIPDGINEINNSDATAPAYNLQGIRVNNAKGLVIRNGKKVVLK